MPLLSREEKRTSIAIPKMDKVQRVSQCYGENAILECGAQKIQGACLKCKNPRCIKYSEDLIECKEFKDFSYEHNVSVCPVDAIKWNYSSEIPEIDQDKCIKCGLCALRCPTGAICMFEGKILVNAPGKDYYVLPATAENISCQEKVITNLMALNWQRRFMIESETLMSEIYNKVSRFDGRSMAANLLVRNLMISIGYHCSISRAGDVYTRIDAVYSDGCSQEACYGAIEIEFGRDTLEASRGILDDIAVLHSRNGIDKKNNNALVVCLSFPNKRQGYFQVVKDVSKVLDIKIQTLSLGALIILAWNGVEVEFKNKDYYADFDNLSIRNAIHNEIGRRLDIPDGMLGIFEPEK